MRVTEGKVLADWTGRLSRRLALNGADQLFGSGLAGSDPVADVKLHQLGNIIVAVIRCERPLGMGVSYSEGERGQGKLPLDVEHTADCIFRMVQTMRRTEWAG